MNTIAVTERAPTPDVGRSAVLPVAGLLLAYVGLLAAGFVAAPAGFTVAAVLVLGLEIVVTRRSAFLSWALGRVQAAAPFRALVAAIALLVLGVMVDAASGSLLLAVAGVLWLHTLRFAGSVLAEAYTRQRRMPILLRGLEPRVPIPSAVPRWLVDRATELLCWPVPLLVAFGGLGYAVDAATVALLVGIVLGSIPAVLGVLRLGSAVLAMRRLPRSRWEQAVSEALDALAPRVVLYHAGGVHTLYQVRSWLATLEELADSDDEAIGTPLVILRDPEAFAELGPTSLPVLCVQPSTMMMGLELPTLRLALYVSHATGNLHMLRRSGVRHAFIGHGDSDKTVTLNPYLRAYTELWVAGPAASERFRRAESSGLRLEGSRILQVGRPQLDQLAAAPNASSNGSANAPDRPVTVLYATTWEGFEDEPHQTSIGELGIALVQALLARGDVRVLYRPHPMAGTRDPAVRAAHRRIVRLLGEAAEADQDRLESPGPHRRANDPLALCAFGPGAFGSRTGQDAARREWTEQQLRAPGHRVVPAPAYDLAGCFRAADVLLCDVSSLITEFLITQKPYGVTNPGARPPGEFEQRYPSTRGGYLVEDTAGLERLYRAVRSPAEHDSSAAARTRLAEQLLGPVPAFATFRAAIRDDTTR